MRIRVLMQDMIIDPHSKDVSQSTYYDEYYINPKNIVAFHYLGESDESDQPEVLLNTLSGNYTAILDQDLILFLKQKKEQWQHEFEKALK